MKYFAAAAITAAGLALAPSAQAATYLNIDNISVSVGAGTTATTSNNTFNNGQTIDKVIDAPSADAEEFHNQTTHIWFSGGGLELEFDFFIEYDISTLHFWNYNGEGFDVDNIDFTFYDGNNVEVGQLSIMPDLGSPGGITAQDIDLPAPLGVRYVTAFLTGSNGQVDFQNLGFTADVTPPDPIPVPAAGVLMASILGAGAVRRKLKKR
ncbi:PEP-CTERM sorting domain-containing protein [Parvularcula sp. ZS-1/3]|uniref:PEP-CTERM sorting domain-containing protein n=1 Tax=Parvularcula mediterranea TaxID=2732508 RepID=A0A7Y3RIU8_9PROT|nr:PEP-CTERM sorting domain-containing protein [Parvularcula mediterranea]NNU14878.1 PEP-CTERM sorting domain-containing protein [Parvularcula mediterranea]